MKTRRNALLLFSKLPEPGKVKTRLTSIKDGFFDPATASYLYECMLFDVVEICCEALVDLERSNNSTMASGDGIFDEYEIIISAPGDTQMQGMELLFAESGEWPRTINFMSDEGDSFDAHYNHAFEQVWQRGFDTVLSMGCDMPALRRSIVVEGFQRLHNLYDLEQGGVVLAPDQEMGVSVVGWTRQTAFDHTGVFYNKEGFTVLSAYLRKCAAFGLPAMYLPDVPDVDSIADLDHNVTLVRALMYCAQFQDDITPPWRTAEALSEIGYTDVRVMPNNLFDDRSDIDV